MFYPWAGQIFWRRKWKHTPISSLENSHKQRSLAGYSPLGLKESDVTEHTNVITHFPYR